MHVYLFSLHFLPWRIMNEVIFTQLHCWSAQNQLMKKFLWAPPSLCSASFLNWANVQPLCTYIVYYIRFKDLIFNKSKLNIEKSLKMHVQFQSQSFFFKYDFALWSFLSCLIILQYLWLAAWPNGWGTRLRIWGLQVRVLPW